MDDERKHVVGKQEQGSNAIDRIEVGNSKSADGLDVGVLKSRSKKSAGSSGADGNSLLRTKRVEVCFSPVEFEQLLHLVKNNRFKSNAEYVRNSALSGQISITPKEQILAIMRFEKQVKKLGANFNQIAKHLNQHVKLDKLVLENLVSTMKDLRKFYADARNQVLKSVSGEGDDH